MHMPELPDLQAFSHTLSRKLAGKKVDKIRAVYRKKLKTPEDDLRRALEGATLTSVYREGKELRLAFDNGNVLGLHLMLKGELHLVEGGHNRKYPIIEITFSDGTGLVMTDWQGQAVPKLNPGDAGAPDALSKEITPKFLKETLARSRATVKKLLTDQKVIRGIGNTYADEILWHARISPFSISNKIPEPAIRTLAKSIRTVLANAEKAILRKQPEIITGEVRDFLPIHNRDRTQSPGGAKILVDQTGGRKTYYTAEQKLYT